MRRLATFEDLLGQSHSLGLYCVDCNRWSEADLEALIACGKGLRLITETRFRCRECGATAEKQVRPPVPAASDAVAYIGG